MGIEDLGYAHFLIKPDVDDETFCGDFDEHIDRHGSEARYAVDLSGKQGLLNNQRVARILRMRRECLEGGHGNLGVVVSIGDYSDWGALVATGLTKLVDIYDTVEKFAESERD